jgi:hypothetical protein
MSAAEDLCRYLATHDAGLGDGDRARRIQRACFAAVSGGDWMAILTARPASVPHAEDDGVPAE